MHLYQQAFLAADAPESTSLLLFRGQLSLLISALVDEPLRCFPTWTSVTV